MDEKKAVRVVDALRALGVDAYVERSSLYQIGVRVALPDKRNAVWDTDGAAGLDATVMADGVLVGFVPMIEGSDNFNDDQVVQAIAQTDYDRPIATRRRTPLPVADPLPRQGGVFRRMQGHFRE